YAQLTAVGNKILAQLQSGTLWISDGSAEGTQDLLGSFVAYRTIASDGRGFFLGDALDYLGGQTGYRGFVAIDGATVSQIAQLPLGEPNAQELVAVETNLFFRGERGSLWKSDGTSAGTSRIDQIFVGDFIAFKDKLAFVMPSPSSAGWSLWIG